MTPELKLLAWTLVLALVQIFLVATLRTRETGLPYNAGPRDFPSPIPVGTLTGRMIRAQHNLFETLPLFIAAILIANVAHIDGALLHWGALLYFWGRLVYVPLYAFGIKYIRTLAWGASTAGLVMIYMLILCPTL